MSNAKTNQQAFREYLNDLKRLNPTRDEFLNSLADGARRAADRHQKLTQRVAEAAQSYLAANKATVDAHIDAELAAAAED